MTSPLKLDNKGLSFGVNPQSEDEMRVLRGMLIITTALFALTALVSSLDGHGFDVPKSLDKWVICPINEVSSALFTLSLIGFLVSKVSKKKEETPIPMETIQESYV